MNNFEKCKTVLWQRDVERASLGTSFAVRELLMILVPCDSLLAVWPLSSQV